MNRRLIRQERYTIGQTVFKEQSNLCNLREVRTGKTRSKWSYSLTLLKILGDCYPFRFMLFDSITPLLESNH
jgi:hypothetical protein